MDENNNGGAVMPITLEKTRINLFHILGIGASIAINAFALGGIYVTMTNNDAKNAAAVDALKQEFANERVSYADRRRTTDTNFKLLFDKMPQFDIVNQQIIRLTELSAANMKSIEETNKRIDRVVDAQNGKLDNIITRLAEVSSDVKVIQSQQQRDNRAERTRFPVLRSAK